MKIYLPNATDSPRHHLLQTREAKSVEAWQKFRGTTLVGLQTNATSILGSGPAHTTSRHFETEVNNRLLLNGNPIGLKLIM
jgi:hypothetical protein